MQSLLVGVSLVMFCGTMLHAQTPPNTISTDEFKNQYKHIFDVLEIDSVVVTANKLDVAEFIRMVEEDETFYWAFANLRHISYQANNEIYCYTKRGKQAASYVSHTAQTVDLQDCRTMKVRNEKVTGNFYKKRVRKQSPEMRYYTAQMYDRLFFTHGKVCNAAKPTYSGDARSATGMEKHIDELKKLIFKPGRKADIPFIGNKTAIFSKKMSRFYDYKIQQKTYNGMDCHVFIVEPKEAYKKRRQDRTVIKYLETYFEKVTHQVVARNYELEFNGIFTFDVKMNIEVSKLDNEMYIPTRIAYDGQWHIPTQATEKCKFVMEFWDFKQPTTQASK